MSAFSGIQYMIYIYILLYNIYGDDCFACPRPINPKGSTAIVSVRLDPHFTYVKVSPLNLKKEGGSGIHRASLVYSSHSVLDY